MGSSCSDCSPQQTCLLHRVDSSKLSNWSYYYLERFKVILTKRESISPDSYMFTFNFENPKESLGQLTTQHIIILGESLQGKNVIRKYTVTESNESEGWFQIPIKIYRPNTHPLYPQGGQMTPWLEQVPLGTKLNIKRVMGKLIYLGQGHCILAPKKNKNVSVFKKILMVCGGTGITPIYQVIQAVMNDLQDKTELFLLYANRTEEDILLKKQLDLFQEQNPAKIKIFYTIDNPDQKWEGFVGHINLKMMQSVFPVPDELTLATLCGPKPFNRAMIQYFQELGVKPNNIQKF